MGEAESIDAAAFRLHVLDVGSTQYGDCELVQVGGKNILIDGAHTGDQKLIVGQLAKILQKQPPFKIDLLIVTHCHVDHIGALPFLVEDNQLDVKWALLADPKLGWGRGGGHDGGDDGGDAGIDAGAQPAPVNRLWAALREESRADEKDDAALAEFIDAAAKLEDRYNDMIDALRAAGTKVVLFNKQSGQGIADVAAAFAGVGMKILGPAEEHLDVCAAYIREVGRDAVDSITDALSVDERFDEVEAYRTMVETIDQPGVGAALNDMTIVVSFERGGKKILLPGDMQFAESEVPDLDEHMDDLLQQVVDAGPYTVVKIPHHGSYNAFSDDVLAAFKDTELFCISTGSDSLRHPNPKTLALLKKNRNKIDWYRTDKNGRITFTFGAQIEIEFEEGKKDDTTPNARDFVPARREEAVKGPETALGPSAATTPQPGGGRGGGGGGAGFQVQLDEITLRGFRFNIPGGAKIGFTMELTGAGAGGSDDDRGPDRISIGGIRVANGRAIPKLLFATSRDALSRNIGQREADRVLGALRDSGAVVVDSLPRGLHDGLAGVERVRAELKRHYDPAGKGGVKGVVLLGGYDVVPPVRLDTLDPRLRAAIGADHGDPDDFIVWSDAAYGCVDDDDIPELAVSRIPDGKSADLVIAAVQAGGAGTGPSAGAGGNGAARAAGVRNIRRPFAQQIYAKIGGSGDMFTSRDVTYRDVAPPRLAARNVYLMLHGDFRDAKSFWGEGAAREAVNVASTCPAGVVFTGCCWGALCSDTPAGMYQSDKPVSMRTPETSIALSFLMKGATAVVGCTGAHYSPLEPPYRYFGSPLHEGFFRHLDAGLAPAEALFRAKIEYLKDIPHGQEGALRQAIEYKVLRQYTCLGLGW